MSDNVDMLSKSLTWKRPPGPINVWKIKESTKKFKNGKPIKFSIQEIPEDRYNDVLDHMCMYFLEDEVLCNASKIKDDELGLKDVRSFWRVALNQGIAVGAFIEDPECDKPILVGVNVLLVATKEDEIMVEQLIEMCKSQRVKKVLNTMLHITSECDIKAIYKIDKYMTAFGLSVDRSYRGENLGLEILKARDAIGRKYGIEATSTIFTGVPSQISAERAGFTVHFEKLYDDVLDDEGNMAYPSLKSKSLKVMHKKLI